MSKKVINDNVRVEVYADCGWRAHPNFRRAGESVMAQQARIADELISTCNSIASEIRRHCDDIGHVSVCYDSLSVCEHCGSAWTEDSPDYNGGCCRKDQEPEDERDRASDVRSPTQGEP